jgi:hypothetical protein
VPQIFKASTNSSARTWIGERDFELYGNVAGMAHQFHDRMR